MWIFKKAYFIFSGKIPELLAAGMVDSMTKLVLVNAIYFKGSWEDEFSKKDTADAPFRLNKVRWGNCLRLPFGPRERG